MEKAEVTGLKNIKDQLLAKLSNFAKPGISDSVTRLWVEMAEISKKSEAVDNELDTIQEEMPGWVNFVKVQYGRKYKGLDVTGEEIFQPLYAYSEKQIMEVTNLFIRGTETIYGAGSKEMRKARKRQERLLAEFGEKMASAKLINDEAGITNLEERQQDLGKLYWKKSEQLTSARAQSLAGVLCQFLRLCDWLELGKEEADDTTRRLAETIALSLNDLIDSCRVKCAPGIGPGA